MLTADIKLADRGYLTSDLGLEWLNGAGSTAQFLLL